MKFEHMVKKINTKDYIERDIALKSIKAQYNTDRFMFWKICCNCDDNDVLDMKFSPHYNFLKWRIYGNSLVQSTQYYKLQKMYGRSHDWIIKKISKFISLFMSIEIHGIKEPIMILEKPIVKNDYNSGYEIFEGHHRVACCLFLNYKNIPCKVIK